MTVMHYLAYGSNLHPYRLTMPGELSEAHCRGCARAPTARLPQAKPLRVRQMHARSGDASDFAYGVLYEFNSQEQAGLNKAEGWVRAISRNNVEYP